MRWKGRRQSDQVEDRRSAGGPVMVGGGLIGVIVILVVMLLGGDPRPLMQEMEKNPPQQQGGKVNPEDDERAQFVAVVLADTEEVWGSLLNQKQETYRKPKLILFRDRVQSACGFQSAATGPFYCPLDEKVYIDLSFFDEMSKRLHASGDFAQAYVVAHEVGHHVQNLLGISDQIHRLQQQSNSVEANELSVRLELQADFFAGVWAHHAERKFQILEQGDIEEALNAAAAIGDDRLQKKQQGFVVPESFTHGTSEQRARWFLLGLKTGDMSKGDTFSIGYEEL